MFIALKCHPYCFLTVSEIYVDHSVTSGDAFLLNSVTLCGYIACGFQFELVPMTVFYLADMKLFTEGGLYFVLGKCIPIIYDSQTKPVIAYIKSTSSFEQL